MPLMVGHKQVIEVKETMDLQHMNHRYHIVASGALGGCYDVPCKGSK